MKRRIERIATTHEHSLVAVTVYDNPTKSAARTENYVDFAASLRRQKVPLLTVAISDSAHQPALQGGDVIQLYAPDRMWHQVAAVNVAYRLLKGRCEAIAWLDADIVFNNDDWVSRTLKTLKRYQVTQPWTTVRYAPPRDAGVVSDWPATDKACAASSIAEHSQTHPGYAWAARMEFVEQVGGLFDACIGGTNDRALLAAFAGTSSPLLFHGMSTGLVDAIKAYCQRVNTVTSGECVIGATAGEITHLYHGNKKQRKYVDRHRVMSQHGFDPVKHLQRQLNGLWGWSCAAPRELQTALRDYFIQRGD